MSNFVSKLWMSNPPYSLHSTHPYLYVRCYTVLCVHYLDLENAMLFLAAVLLLLPLYAYHLAPRTFAAAGLALYVLTRCILSQENVLYTLHRRLVRIFSHEPGAQSSWQLAKVRNIMPSTHVYAWAKKYTRRTCCLDTLFLQRAHVFPVFLHHMKACSNFFSRTRCSKSMKHSQGTQHVVFYTRV